MATERIGVLTGWDGSVAPLLPGYPIRLLLYGPEGTQPQEERAPYRADDYYTGYAYGPGRGFGWGRGGYGWGRGFRGGFGRGFGWGRGGFGWGHGFRGGFGRGYGWGRGGFCVWDYIDGLSRVDTLILRDADPWLAEELLRQGVKLVKSQRNDPKTALEDYMREKGHKSGGEE